MWTHVARIQPTVVINALECEVDALPDCPVACVSPQLLRAVTLSPMRLGQNLKDPL